jgi:hypothetical protein
MFPEIIEGNPPTSTAAIEAFERERGLALPALYKQFLLVTNGGRPTSPLFPIDGMALNPQGSIQFFLGVENRKWPVYDLAETHDWYAGGIPHGVVPIACTGMGDYICLDLRDGKERVAFWDHRHFWGTGEWRESDLYHVADSFAEFLASLRPDPSGMLG